MAGNPLVLGILGGIASGKSTVAAMLGSLGARVVDADQLAHQVLRDPEVRPGIVALFGSDAVSRDGAVDTALIAEIVFGDPDLLAGLEELIHPRVREGIIAVIEESAAADIVVVDAPLLIEAGLDGLADALLFVEASGEDRKARARWKRAWSAEELTRREASQMPVERKRRRADYVVINDGSIEDLRAHVAQIYREILEDMN